MTTTVWCAECTDWRLVVDESDEGVRHFNCGHTSVPS